MQANTIFIQIASYRDPDCKNTIRDLFQKAKHPENIFIGLNWQYSEEDTFSPYYEEDTYLNQIRIVKYDCKESQGVCWARAQTQLLYNNETYTLQIDAHMRFIENWDEALLEMYSKLIEHGIKKPIISHYPPNFTLDGEFEQRQGKMTSYIRNDGIVYFKLSGYSIEQYDDMPLPSASVAGGFIFANAQWIKEVPYDPNLYFHGEEITLSVRLWTHGWDIFNPTKIIMYHLYQSRIDKESGEKVKVREIKLHKDDNNDYKIREKRSVLRIKYLLGTSHFINDKEALKDIEHFSLGTQRSLYQYENYSGIDFKQLTRNHFARLGIFFNDITPNSQEEEIHYLEKLQTSIETVYPSVHISKILKHFNISSIVGITNHDFIQNINNNDFNYIGLNISQKNIDMLRYYFRLESNKIFYQQNILREALPKADAIFCGDFFKLSKDNFTWQLLANIRKSGIKYILATHSNKLIRKYFLPKPIVLLPYKKTSIGVWDAQEISIYLYPLNSNYANKRFLLIPRIEEKLYYLKNILHEYQKEYKEIIARAHSNLNSSLSREIINLPNIKPLLTQNNNFGMALIEDILRIRFWSNEEKIIAEFPFITKEDKQFILALINEFLQNYEATL